MTIFTNYLRKVHHIIDRLPETEEEWENIKIMFKGCVLIRKSTKKPILINDSKFKNLHWYV